MKYKVHIFCAGLNQSCSIINHCIKSDPREDFKSDF